MNPENLSLIDALLIAVIGFITVFSVLGILCIFIQFVSKLLSKANSNEKQPEKKVVKKNNEVDETIVLITAALAAYLGKKPSEFIVKEYRKIDSSSNWRNSSKLNQMS